jgi:hypothetical protein
MNECDCEGIAGLDSPANMRTKRLETHGRRVESRIEIDFEHGPHDIRTRINSDKADNLEMQNLNTVLAGPS